MSYDANTVRAVGCTKCQVAPGSLCRSLKTELPVNYIHSARYLAYAKLQEQERGGEAM